MSLAFVPPRLAKKAKVASRPAAPSLLSVSAAVAGPSSETRAGTEERTKRKGKEREQGRVEADYAALVSVSFSDHALWTDAELRQMVEGEPDGFISLGGLIQHTSLSRQNPQPSELTVVRGLREHFNDVFEVRMLVSAPSKSNWYTPNTERVKDGAGGYEIRRRDWEALPSRLATYSRQYWEDRTIYVENCPTQYRSIAGIHNIVAALLKDPPIAGSSTSSGTLPIQSIVLPPHHLDKPGDQPKCKGFALVTLARTEAAHVLLERWPWSPTPDADHAPCKSTVAQECRRFGFRCLSKREWTRRNDEYLAYRQRLLDEIAAQDERPPARTAVETAPVVQDDPSQAHRSPSPVAATGAITQPWSPYPMNCLVFCRNVHPQTNKTTLKTLFSAPFASEPAIDYVDFTKGMDSCYLRVSTPTHAQTLLDHFQGHPTGQTSGLDTGASEDSADVKRITLELVQGKKEELYWEKVPEKIRRQAVQKAVAAEGSSVGQPDGEGQGRQRKRTRRH